MKNKHEDNPERQAIEQAAADWTLRIDRGLSASEQDAFTEWLSADPRHREAMRLYRWGWEEFDRLAGLQTTRQAHTDPDLLAPPGGLSSVFAGVASAFGGVRHASIWAALPLAAALCIGLFVYLWWFGEGENGQPQEGEKEALELISRIEQKLLPDGSHVDLNRGASIEIAFTPAERRVRLVRGESVFSVERDPSRPFVVEVAGVDIRAVGTVFNVRYGSNRVDVIVAEGKVDVRSRPRGTAGADASEGALLEFQQRAIVDLNLDTLRIEVDTLSEDELERELRWQPRLLEFDAAPLETIISEFNRHNPVQVSLGDSDLESITLSSAFWSDNVEGFVRLMESSFGMKAEWASSREIVLRRRGEKENVDRWPSR